MGKIIKISVFLGILAQTAIAPSALARDTNQITDWYIKDFQSTITVNTDSSLLVEEKIIADCGDLPDKHGIFRVVPLETKTEKGTVKTPVELISIADFDDRPIKYSETKDNFNHTVAWKIGDADKNVTGENYYKIIYSVKNAVRAGNADFDELYWNLLGNFWGLEIENFRADIIFPEGVSQNNTDIYLYAGQLDAEDNRLTKREWIDSGALRITSTSALSPRQGVTVSATFPKGIIAPYQPGFFELYGDYLWFLIPVLTFIICFAVWNKYGKDPRVDKTVIPEFEIPENLTPMQMGLLFKNGSFGDSLISATIIDLAVKKYIIIEEIPKQGIFGQQNFRLKRIEGSGYPSPNETEELLLKKLFGHSQEVLLSKLKNEFHKELPEIKKTAINNLKQKELIHSSGLTLKGIFLVLAVILIFAAFAGAGTENLFAIIAFGISAAVVLIFGLLMPKRTPKGAELNWRIKGFKLYMETAEKYRTRFHEKENIFEKFLPYAIVFGIAKLWVKKMEQIYGKEYFAAYHSAWYAGNFASGFNADSFAAQINSISSGIAANIGTTSGAHGAGGAGGGGGGGGGGGW